MDYHGKVKGEDRARKQRKAKTAPRGAGFAAQAKREEINRGYARVGRKSPLAPRVTVTIKSKNSRGSSKESPFII